MELAEHVRCIFRRPEQNNTLVTFTTPDAAEHLGDRSSSEMKGADESVEMESDAKVKRNKNNVVYIHNHN